MIRRLPHLSSKQFRNQSTDVDVLVLGNSLHINEIRFDLLKPNIITLGVNRIWLKHVPNFLFFHDSDIIYEIQDHPEIDFSKTVLITSDWLKTPLTGIANRFKSVLVFDRQDKVGFPDSVSTAMQIFASNIMPGKSIQFYIAGVTLKWSDPSHFWKAHGHKSRNKNTHEWYSKRFAMMFNNFQRLIALGFNIKSVTPTSMLNRICKSYHISHLYVNSIT